MRTLIACLLAILTVTANVLSHERREIDGMQVVFGGEPEPVLDGELQFLRWRLTELENKQPVTDLQEVQAKIRFDGKEFGPFEARSSRQDPGMYQTHHVFTKAGEGEATLTFKREGKNEPLSLTVPFRVVSRKSIEIL